MSLCLLRDEDGRCTDPDCAAHEAELGELEFRREVGLRLRAERVRQGLSQHDLGIGAGLTRAAVGKIERGAHKVDVWRLHLLARVLDVQVSRLLGEAREHR